MFATSPSSFANLRALATLRGMLDAKAPFRTTHFRLCRFTGLKHWEGPLPGDRGSVGAPVERLLLTKS